MTDRELLQKALEALEMEAKGYADRYHRLMPIIWAITERLKQPEQESLAGCACRWDHEDNRVVTCERHKGWLDVVAEWADRARAAEDALKKQSPQRQPLTDEALDLLLQRSPIQAGYGDLVELSRAIEAAHGITGEKK